MHTRTRFGKTGRVILAAMENRNRLGMIIGAGVFALIAIGIASFTYFSGTTPSANPAVSPVVSAPQDKSGFSAWEETLRTIAGKNATGTSGEDLSNYKAPENLSPTDALGRELYAKYLVLAQSGKLGTPDEASAIADIINNHVAAPASKTYAEKDLTIGSASDATAIAAYRKAVVAAIADADRVPEYELITFNTLMETRGGAQASQRLLNDAAIYRGIITKLLKIPVPPTLVKNHLGLINALSSLVDSIGILRTSYADPLTALVSTGGFARAEEALRTTFDEFNSLTSASTTP